MKKSLILPIMTATLLFGTVSSVNASTVTTKGNTSVKYICVNKTSKKYKKGKIAKAIIKAKKVTCPKGFKVVKKPTTKTSTTVTNKTKTTPTNTTNTTNEKSSTLSAYELKVVELTNIERQKTGLKLLVIDNELSRVARIKSQEMTDKHYFDHNSPTYGPPFDMMKHFGITYRAAAENIAKGQKTPEEVVTAWMNSSGHRANILNGNLTYIGVGYDSRENTWTQQFISK